jgi:hypothetical protein
MTARRTGHTPKIRELQPEFDRRFVRVRSIRGYRGIGPNHLTLPPARAQRSPYMFRRRGASGRHWCLLPLTPQTWRSPSGQRCIDAASNAASREQRVNVIQPAALSKFRNDFVVERDFGTTVADSRQPCPNGWLLRRSCVLMRRYADELSLTTGHRCCASRGDIGSAVRDRFWQASPSRQNTIATHEDRFRYFTNFAERLLPATWFEQEWSRHAHRVFERIIV